MGYVLGEYYADVNNDTRYSNATGNRYLKKCPKNYVENKTRYDENGKPVLDESGKTITYKEVKMKELLDNLYIPIGVKYNFQTKEYVWFILNWVRANICVKGDGNLKLVLFEPRINE